MIPHSAYRIGAFVGVSLLGGYPLFWEKRKLEFCGIPPRPKAPPLDLEHVLARRSTPSPNSRYDPLIRLCDYEHVMLNQLELLDGKRMVEPPIFEWDGTVIDFMDMLDFARAAIRMVEAQLEAHYAALKSSPHRDNPLLGRAQDILALERRRSGIAEIEMIARKLIHSPRFANN